MPRNHPLFLGSVEEDLWLEFYEDAIELHIQRANDEDGVEIDLDSLRYDDVFPADEDPESVGQIVKKLMQDNPQEDLGNLLEAARRMQQINKKIGKIDGK